jgi:tRNA G18 (ribose-2'-O)-methylase SpoU
LPDIVRVTEIDDPRIGAYAKIRERDLVGREGLFIAEGAVVVKVLIERSSHQVVSLFLAEKRLAALAPLLERLADTVPVHVASQAVMDRVAGFPMHRGILALGRRAPAVPARSLLAGTRPEAVVLALFGIANHDNVGGLFRNAAAFGAAAVLLDADCCDPLYRKAIRVSVGAALIVPFARIGRGEDALSLLAEAGFEPLALSPSGTETLEAVRPGGRRAVLLGTEGAGLPPDLMARARSVRIPMAPGFDSLNVATAGGIVLHHLTSGRTEAPTLRDRS